MLENRNNPLYRDPSSEGENSVQHHSLPLMDLPPDQEIFEEEQPFDQSWIWIMLGVETLAILLPMILTGQPWWVLLVGAIAMVMTLSLMSSLKLKSRIDDEGIHFRMNPFHWKEKTIPWNEIESVYVRQYNPILEYGGWGIRFGRSGKAFNVRGNMGIQVIKKDGRRILIGTQMSDAAIRALEQRPLMV